VRIAISDFPANADAIDVRLFDETDDINAVRIWPSASGSQWLHVSSYGIAGNLELLLPVRGKLKHFWRQSEPQSGRTWHGPVDAAPASPNHGTALTAAVSSSVRGASLIQGPFGKPGNLEAVVRIDTGATAYLAHVVRGPGGWSSPSPILVQGKRIEHVTGNPALIKSTAGTRGNFELLVPVGKRLLHYYRDNDAAGYPWHGPILVHDFSQVASPGAHQPENLEPISVSLVQSHGQPGRLEAVAVVQHGIATTRLWAFEWGATGWRTTGPLSVGSTRIEGVTAAAALIQGNLGRAGNLELLVPSGARILHYWRDNDSKGLPWHGPNIVFDQANSSMKNEFLSDVALVQNGVRWHGDLEALVAVTSASGQTSLLSLLHGATGWTATWPVNADGQPIRDLTLS
jgi:hypothetical protein